MELLRRPIALLSGRACHLTGLSSSTFLPFSHLPYPLHHMENREGDWEMHGEEDDGDYAPEFDEDDDDEELDDVQPDYEDDLQELQDDLAEAIHDAQVMEDGAEDGNPVLNILNSMLRLSRGPYSCSLSLSRHGRVRATRKHTRRWHEFIPACGRQFIDLL